MTDSPAARLGARDLELADRVPRRQRDGGRGDALAAVATGDAVIKGPSPLNVPKYTYNRSYYLARSDEHQHLTTDSPTARLYSINTELSVGTVVQDWWGAGRNR